jgi:hypothetical protein
MGSKKYIRKDVPRHLYLPTDILLEISTIVEKLLLKLGKNIIRLMDARIVFLIAILYKDA